MKSIQFFSLSVRNLLKLFEEVSRYFKTTKNILRSNRDGKKIQKFLEKFIDSKDYRHLENIFYGDWEHLSLKYGEETLECRISNLGLYMTTPDMKKWAFPDITGGCILPHLSLCYELIEDHDLLKVLGPFDSFSEASKYMVAYYSLVEIFRYEVYNKSILVDGAQNDNNRRNA